MFELILIVGMGCVGFIVVWTIGVLVFKVCFKIADFIFR